LFAKPLLLFDGTKVGERFDQPAFCALKSKQVKSYPFEVINPANLNWKTSFWTTSLHQSLAVKVPFINYLMQVYNSLDDIQDKLVDLYSGNSADFFK